MIWTLNRGLDWPRHLIKSARIELGDRTLDVAFGTGALPRDLAKTVGKSPMPVGLDISPGMLVVAQRLNPEIQWRHGDAQALPFEDGSFERVLCQFGRSTRCAACRSNADGIVERRACLRTGRVGEHVSRPFIITRKLSKLSIG